MPTTETQVDAAISVVQNETQEAGNSRFRISALLTLFKNWAKDTFMAKITGHTLLSPTQAAKIETIADRGVAWKTGPAGTVIITEDDPTYSFTETAAVITVNGADVAIPQKELVFEKANLGTKLKAISVAKYTTDPYNINGASVTDVGYYLIKGAAVPENDPSVTAPSTPPGFLFVRDIDVTDGTAAPTTTTPTPIALDNNVTQNSSNGVKSSAIWTWAKGLFIEKVTQTGADSGKVLTANGSGGHTYQAVTATAGGTEEGSVQFRNAGGMVTGTNILKWMESLKELWVGTLAVPAKLKVWGNSSALWTIQDGLPWVVVVNDNMPDALVFKTKDGTVLLQIDTNDNNEKIITMQSSRLNGGVFAPVDERQLYADTASTTKVFCGKDTAAGVFEVIVFPLENVSNWMMAEAWVIGTDENGNVGAKIQVNQMWQRGSTTGLHQVGTGGVSVETYGAAGTPTATFEPNGSGISLSITPGVATAWKWKVYCPNMNY